MLTHVARAAARSTVTHRLLAMAIASPVRSMATQRRLRLEAASIMLPGPGKEQTGGEDACFTEGRCFGVFDGVGGWAEQGIDPALFSRSLCSRTAAALSGSPPDLVAALGRGLDGVTHTGSSTACLVHVADDGQLSALNVGDSGFYLLRPDASARGESPGFSIAVCSRSQQHYFNCPYQLGTGSSTRPKHGELYHATAKPGDVLLLMTDGMLDNLFPADVEGANSRRSLSEVSLKSLRLLSLAPPQSRPPPPQKRRTLSRPNLAQISPKSLGRLSPSDPPAASHCFLCALMLLPRPSGRRSGGVHAECAHHQAPQVATSPAGGNRRGFL